MSERQAIEALRRGDIGGLEALVRAHQVRALRAAYLVTLDRALSEEIVQAAFLRAYERIGQFDPERPFGPWFLRSMVHDARKAVARRGRQVPLDDQGRSDDVALVDLLEDPHPGPEQVVEVDELREALRRALECLPPERRAAVVLRYYVGHGEADVAERLGRPRGTIRRWLFEARERLRGLLAAVAPPAAP